MRQILLILHVLIVVEAILGKNVGKWVHVKELLNPLESCQFVLTTFGLWREHFPPVGTAILSAITGMNNHVQLLSTLRHYRREQHVIRHQSPCLVHLSLHPPPGPLVRQRSCDIPMVLSGKIMSVHRHHDLVILFVDDRIRPAYQLLGRNPCFIPNNYIIFDFKDVYIWDNPVIQLARRGRKVVTTRFAKDLGLKVIGATFVEIFEGIGKLRMDFHNDIVMLYSTDRDGLLYRHDKVYITLQTHLIYYTLHGEIDVVPFLHLTDKFNFTVRATEGERIGSGLVCRFGSFRSGVIPVTDEEERHFELHVVFYKDQDSYKVFYLHELRRPAAIVMKNILSPLSSTVWILLAVTIGIASAVCSAIIKASPGMDGSIRIIMSVSSALILQAPPVPKKVLPHIAFWTLVSTYISNYYLAYLSSSVTLPDIIKEDRIIDELLQTGRKFYAASLIEADMKTWVTTIELSDNKPRSLDTDTKLLHAVLSGSDSAQFSNIQDALRQKYALVFPLRMAKPLMLELSKSFGQNAHVLKQEFMRSVRWYSIDGPYDDILAAGFRRLVDAGIERFWVGKNNANYRIAVLALYLEDTPVELGGDYTSPALLNVLARPWNVRNESKFVAATIDDSLISECFTAYGIGISIAMASFLVAAVWLMAQSIIEWDFVTVE